ncbi:Carbon monoxide dehydrogenase subunit G [Actinopolyspora mzabensis]|uniref:Carbon monoxide dehydrogenase subunit G n=1 Tax=Actinopolyspora mzabensis TaxID=995066 RepID=A0A1G9C5J0_ACTMZ|nr:SRPBCC family protein [Actinopolyspora mzabensis]SDK46674.1 Carbon monoxide dehydrogenase subunit G [Actinopolyspora mzabensis]
MRLEHEFTVPVPADVAWPVLLDPEQVAPCMPGATLKSAEGEEFAGSVKVKLGPVSLMYKGNGSFTEVDHEERRAVIEASGKDSRGNGTASASVTARLASEGTSTRVHVGTELKVTGKPAQLGRGLISDVAQKLIDQFAECLAGRLTGGESVAAAGQEPLAGQEPATGKETVTGESAAQQGTQGTSTTASSSETPRDQGAGQPGASASAGPVGNGSGPAASNDGDRSTASPASGPSTGETSGGASAPAGSGPGWKVTEVESGESSRSTARLSAVHPGATGGSSTSNDAVDLLGTAGMPVLKRVAPLVAGLAALTVLFVLLRRRARRAE